MLKRQSIRGERDEIPKDDETVFQRLQRHADQSHGITLSRAETKEVADRLFGELVRNNGESLLRWQNESKIAELEERLVKFEEGGNHRDADVWQAIRDHVDKIYRLEHQVDELQQRIWKVEEGK